MTETKTCTYQSCKNVFERLANTPNGTWEQLKRCPACRKKAHRQRPIDSMCMDTKLGRYEVKSDIIDRFLYATASPNTMGEWEEINRIAWRLRKTTGGALRLALLTLVDKRLRSEVAERVEYLQRKHARKP